MNCPYCKSQMEKGYVEQDLRHPLLWYSATGTGNTLFSKRRHMKLSSLLKGGTVTMYHCERCKKFIIDESELEV